MKSVFSSLFFVSLFAPLAGADIVKVRLNNDSYRIILTGADAQALSARMGKEIFSSSSPVDSLACTESPMRCEFLVKAATVHSFADVQERLRLAQEMGLPAPQANLPRNSMEQVLTATIDDSTSAARLYALLPGPEKITKFDHTVAADFTGRNKSLALPGRNDLSLSCQQVERLGDTLRKGYSCAFSAIVPVPDSRQADANFDSH